MANQLRGIGGVHGVDMIVWRKKTLGVVGDKGTGHVMSAKL